MSAKYNSLEELKRKKSLLKKEVAELEDLLTFDNAKESLSALTNGYTDQFLKDEIDENGDHKLGIKKEAVTRQISNTVKEKLIGSNPVLGFADSALKGGAMGEAVKLGVVAMVGNFARKKMKSSNWKQKALGLVLIYLAPYALRFIRQKLEDYQQRQSVSSMEQLI